MYERPHTHTYTHTPYKPVPGPDLTLTVTKAILTLDEIGVCEETTSTTSMFLNVVHVKKFVSARARRS